MNLSSDIAEFSCFTSQEIKVGVSDLPVDKDNAVSMEPYPVIDSNKSKYKGTSRFSSLLFIYLKKFKHYNEITRVFNLNFQVGEIKMEKCSEKES